MKIAPHFLQRKLSVVSLPSSSLQTAVQILQDPPARRKENQVQQLAAYLDNLKFFSELEARTEVVRACCKHLTYEGGCKGTAVFRKGDSGDKFYIILSGILGVYIHTTVKREVLQEAGIALIKSSLELQEVRELRSGDTFGELALITNSVRAATVQCKTDCHLAVMGKADYLRVLGKLEQQKLQELVQFLQTLPLFRGWGKTSTQRISYYFTHVDYLRKQTVYSVHDPATHVYIVRHGEFELSQDVTKSMGKMQGAKHFFHKYTVSILGKGELFGDSEVMQGLPRQYSCTCVSAHGTLLVVSKPVTPTQQFLKRVLTEDDTSQISRLQAAKDNLRESRVKKAILLNSGLLGQTFSQSSSVLSLNPPPARHIHVSSIDNVPQNTHALEDWKRILKRHSRKPESRKGPRRAASRLAPIRPIHHRESLHTSMVTSPNGCLHSEESLDRSLEEAGRVHTEESFTIQESFVEKHSLGRQNKLFRRLPAH